MRVTLFSLNQSFVRPPRNPATARGREFQRTKFRIQKMQPLRRGESCRVRPVPLTSIPAERTGGPQFACNVISGSARYPTITDDSAVTNLAGEVEIARRGRVHDAHSDVVEPLLMLAVVASVKSGFELLLPKAGSAMGNGLWA